MVAISAKVLADSVSPFGCRLTTLELVFPRIILAEFNTHRMLSRNAASSRAIPLSRRVKQAEEDPFIPLVFEREQKGMSGGEEVERAATAAHLWTDAAFAMAAYARQLGNLGVHKNIVNRLLEPFAWVTVVASATNWSNLLYQREHPAAEQHFQVLATAIHNVIQESTPTPIPAGGWHLPYYDSQDTDALVMMGQNALVVGPHISAARCARVSVTPFDSEKRDIEADLRVWTKLVERTDTHDPKHWSPLEHPAISMPEPDRYGNFVGWCQLRKLHEDEYVKEPWERWSP